jgi:hypothetical protein
MWLALSVATFVVAVVGHAILRRWQRLPLNPVSAFLAPGVPVGVLLWLLLLWRGNTAMETIAAVLSYALACELYIFVFTFVSSSVTVSLLLKLRHGRANWEQLSSTYSDEAMVDGRLTKLIRNALIAATPSGYVTSGRGERLVTSFDRLRRFFKHTEPSERSERSERTAGGLVSPAAAPSTPYTATEDVSRITS